MDGFWVLQLRWMALVFSGPCVLRVFSSVETCGEVFVPRGVAHDMHPLAIAKQVNGLVITNAYAGALAIQLPLADHSAYHKGRTPKKPELRHQLD